MSLKAKLEAVIYASEEPVTLNQLAALFAADALEWKAAQAAAGAEQAAELAGEVPLPLEPFPAEAAAEPSAESPAPENPASTEVDAPEPDASAHHDAAGAVAGLAFPAAETVAGTPAEPATEAPPADPAAEIAEIVEAAQEESPEPAAEAEDLSAQPETQAETQPEAQADVEAEGRRLARLRDREIKAVLKQLLDELIAAYASDDHGVEIREIAGGYRMATKPECHDAVRLFVKSLKPPMKLSLPALETLAVVAYKQPVTAPEVSEIRGVESGGVLGSLLARKLIATAGRKQVIGRPILYKTTKEFLLRFGLKDLSELPSMEEFEKMAGIEIEQEMEPEAVAADAAQDAEEAAEEAGIEETDSASSSPDGEELAEESENAEEAPEAETPATQPQEINAIDIAEPPAGTAAEYSATRNPIEAEPAEPEPIAQAENEAVAHATQENQENR